jgi:hypothetical protein
LGDAERVRHWIETGDALPLPAYSRPVVARAKGPVRGTMKPVSAQAPVKAKAKAPRR